MVNIDTDRLTEVAQATFDLATNHKDARRWQTAVAKAKQQLESNPDMHFDGGALLVLSPVIAINVS